MEILFFFDASFLPNYAKGMVLIWPNYYLTFNFHVKYDITRKQTLISVLFINNLLINDVGNFALGYTHAKKYTKLSESSKELVQSHGLLHGFTGTTYQCLFSCPILAYCAMFLLLVTGTELLKP